MSVTEVRLKRLDDLSAEEVLLEGGESFLGKYFIFLTITPDKERWHIIRATIQYNDIFQDGDLCCRLTPPIYLGNMPESTSSLLRRELRQRSS